MKKLTSIVIVLFLSLNIYSQKAKLKDKINEKEKIETVKEVINNNIDKLDEQQSVLLLLDKFPQSENGLNKKYIILPSLNDESNYRVELTPFTKMEVDCNKHFLDKTLVENIDKVSSYPFYTLAGSDRINSTKMMCFDNKNTIKEVDGKSKIINYNSKLPIVIYLNSQYDIKYRILTPSEIKYSESK